MGNNENPADDQRSDDDMDQAPWYALEPGRNETIARCTFYLIYMFVSYRAFAGYLENSSFSVFAFTFAPGSMGFVTVETPIGVLLCVIGFAWLGVGALLEFLSSNLMGRYILPRLIHRKCPVIIGYYLALVGVVVQMIVWRYG